MAGHGLLQSGDSLGRCGALLGQPKWGAASGYPLGRWIADVRRYYTAGALEAARTRAGPLTPVW